MDDALTPTEAAKRVGTTPATLKRWVDAGLIPHLRGRKRKAGWTPAAVSHARIVKRLRDRGHSIAEIREAANAGRLAYGFMEDMFPRAEGAEYTIDDVAELTGLEPALIQRFSTALGIPIGGDKLVGDEDVHALQYVASVLAAGFPLVALLQLARVWGQALAQIADAEVRLFHIYVHEPLIRENVPALEIADQMENLARDLLPLTSPLMDYIHQRFLGHYVEQDVVGHMELELDDDADLGRLKVAVAFCDLAGYTRFTEEEGEEEALSFVERFVEVVINTLPEDARVIKTIGDEVMVVGQDVQALTDWAVGFQTYFEERPLPRIGLHYGAALYRDGDYFGREINLASRVVARARGGEVLVTDSVVEQVAESQHLMFEPIGQVKLKGFTEPRALVRATAPHT